VNLPRALIGSVRCMARPARPEREVAAVREAAAVIRGEMQRAAPPAVAQEIATRVVAELLVEVDGLVDDPFLAALQNARRSPFVTLATCPEIDTLSEFVERRVERLRARAGSYLAPAQQADERKAIAEDVEQTLSRRYLRHLRR
jgi:hypothetical protein